MKKGLLLGKFMPVHAGHLALVEFGLSACDELTVLLCYHEQEIISGKKRMDWLTDLLQKNSRVVLKEFCYDKTYLTDSSESSYEESAKWAARLKEIVPDINLIISSEPYGKYVADILNIPYVCFDAARKKFPVSASCIRSHPFTYWHYIPQNVRPLFVKKVCLLGSESTGKSTLARNLAAHYNTVFVPEMAREIIRHTRECVHEDLYEIASLHAKTILKKQDEANKLLFCDTDLLITRSYSEFLFSKPLEVEDWIESANEGHLYFFLEADCDFIQDGTRLQADERDRLSLFHKKQLSDASVNYISITGNWEERFKMTCYHIDQFINAL